MKLLHALQLSDYVCVTVSPSFMTLAATGLENLSSFQELYQNRTFQVSVPIPFDSPLSSQLLFNLSPHPFPIIRIFS